MTHQSPYKKMSQVKTLIRKGTDLILKRYLVMQAWWLCSKTETVLKQVMRKIETDERLQSFVVVNERSSNNTTVKICIGSYKITENYFTA